VPFGCSGGRSPTRTAKAPSGGFIFGTFFIYGSNEPLIPSVTVKWPLIVVSPLIVIDGAVTFTAVSDSILKLAPSADINIIPSDATEAVLISPLIDIFSILITNPVNIHVIN
jgi:hypothetical protein